MDASMDEESMDEVTPTDDVTTPADATHTPVPQATAEVFHSREDLLAYDVAASFGVSFETLNGAFHLAGFQPGQMLSRSEVEAALAEHAQRIIP